MLPTTRWRSYGLWHLLPSEEEGQIRRHLCWRQWTLDWKKFCILRPTIAFEFWMHTQLLPCSGGSITIQTIWLSEQATTKMLLICEEANVFWLDLMENKCGAHSGCYGMDTIRDLYVLSPWCNSAKMSEMFSQSRRYSSKSNIGKPNVSPQCQDLHFKSTMRTYWGKDCTLGGRTVVKTSSRSPHRPSQHIYFLKYGSQKVCLKMAHFLRLWNAPPHFGPGTEMPAADPWGEQRAPIQGSQNTSAEPQCVLKSDLRNACEKNC